MANIKLTQFGGIAPRNQPQNLHQAMAQVAHDVDLSRQSLRPWRTDKKISDQTGKAFFTDGCCVLASEHCRAFYSKIETDCDYIVASQTGDYPMIATLSQACQGNWHRLGFPIEIPTPTAQHLGQLPNDFNNEARQYFYTLVNELGHESLPSLPSEPIYANNDAAVVISGLPHTNAFPTYAISYIRLYCAVTPLDYGEMVKDPNADAAFLLVDEIPFGQSSYVHQPHTEYGSECLTEEYEPPADTIWDLQYCGNGQLGGLVGTELWLSEPLKPHAFPEAYRYGRFHGTPIRFLSTAYTGYILTDSKPAVIELANSPQPHGQRQITLIDEPLPLISRQSACLYNGACFYATKDGLVMLAGNQAKVISTALWTADQWQALAPWTMIGIVHEGYYFGFTETISFRLKVPDSIHEQVQIETLTTLSIQPQAVYRSEQGDLFFATEDGIYQWNAGDRWKTFRWVGRLNTMAGYTAFSAYKIVQDFAENRVIHTACKRHRNELVGERVVLGDKVVTDSRPHRLKSGYATIQIEVEISGQGEVWEYHLATSVSELGGQ